MRKHFADTRGACMLILFEVLFILMVPFRSGTLSADSAVRGITALTFQAAAGEIQGPALQAVVGHCGKSALPVGL